MRQGLSLSCALCVLLCGVLLFAANIYSLDAFPLDDAWIHRVYARAIAAGDGFAYNAGQQEAGLTSPLWVLVTAPAHWLEPFGRHVVTLAVKLIGIGLGFGSLLVLHRLTYHITRSALAAGLAAALVALEPRFLVSLSSGMEPVLVLLLWLSVSLSLFRSRWGWAALWVSLLPLARPESLVFFAVWLPAVWLCSNQSVVDRWLLSLLIWLPTGLWGLFCYTTTGHWIPNTFYLKVQAVP